MLRIVFYVSFLLFTFANTAPNCGYSSRIMCPDGSAGCLGQPCPSTGKRGPGSQNCGYSGRIMCPNGSSVCLGYACPVTVVTSFLDCGYSNRKLCPNGTAVCIGQPCPSSGKTGAGSQNCGYSSRIMCPNGSWVCLGYACPVYAASFLNAELAEDQYFNQQNEQLRFFDDNSFNLN
jgi:hypothetical protein